MTLEFPGEPLVAQELPSVKDRLLASAIRAFSERGFYGARIEDIVAGAGVNVRMIYHYYGSKEGLYDEAILCVSGAFFHAAFDAIQFHDGSAVERLEKALHAYGLAVLSNLVYAKMMVWERTSGSEAVQRLVAPEEDVEVLFENLVRSALCETSAETDEDAKLMATLCVGSPFLLVSQAGHHGMRQEQISEMMDLVWKLALKSFGLAESA